jgi:uncharacterized protein YceH (UPF0502 family)
VELNAVEARVIGSLAEKQLSTPQQYPLTMNALVSACNQSSNRDPVVAYDEGTVETALSSLKEAGLLRFVHPGKGHSATRYRQVVEERFGFEARGLSVLAVLLLRGPQTLGELRTRTERMADFDSLDSIHSELDRLAGLPDPLVRCLGRRAGQKEDRWTELLSGGAGGTPGDAAIGAGQAQEQVQVPVPGLEAAPSRPGPLEEEVAALRADVDALREEVALIGSLVDDLLGQVRRRDSV